jgi:hypothetical protein
MLPCFLSRSNTYLLPSVAEVVLVPEHIPFIAEKFAKAPPPFVSHLRGVVGIGNPVLLLSEPKEVKMNETHIPKLTNGKPLKIKRK